MAQLQLVRQNQAGNAHIDGATPSYLPTSINQPNQNMPHRSEFSQDRRQLRHLCPKKDNSDVFPGGFASCLGIALMSFLVVLPPVLGQLWCLSWWFCLLPWDNSDRCSIFWLGWLMDVGRYEGVAPSMWHSQPDFGEWVGVASSMSLKMTYFCNLLRSGNLPLCLALENGPHQVPRKVAFSWVCQRKLDTWWGPFSGANPSGKLALRWFPSIFFLNIKLPFWA